MGSEGGNREVGGNSDVDSVIKRNNNICEF